jgi:cobalt-zinc-cadmium efflux system membrane fusion protein
MVTLTPGALKAANIETVTVAEREATSLVAAPGTVEPNQEKTQQATPLVSGRVARVNAALGDRVVEGGILAVIFSPEVAGLHGRLHHAETRLTLAQQNLERVQRAENRVGVLQAKARLEEAEANLKRTRRLIELGAAAGKDLTASEASYASAKAEYEFQNSVPLNREIQDARGEVETARVAITELRSALAAIDVVIPDDEDGTASHDTSVVNLRSPMSGVITERFVNAGAGIEAGKPMFTIADLSTLWVIANVPEGWLHLLGRGASAEITGPDLAGKTLSGRVTYVAPTLNEETRTGRVRVEIGNSAGQLKAGMFVDVRFPGVLRSPALQASTAMVIPDAAIQRIGDRSVVFIPGDGGAFEVRNIEPGEVVGTGRQVLSGLKTGERVVTRGSFILKTQMLKSELAED